MAQASRSTARSLLLALILVVAASSYAVAQGRGGGAPGGGGPGGGGPMGGGPGGPMGGGPMGGGGFPGETRANSGIANERPATSSAPRPVGLQLGPPGVRWWDDKSIAKSLKLKPEQQTRMDAIFEQNRGALLSRLEDLRQAETHMDELTHASTLDESALFSQIDRVAQARAGLEKANTHMLLQLRAEMNPDQIARLDKRQ